MSSGEFQLGEFLSGGVQRIVARAIVIAKGDRRESRFFADFFGIFGGGFLQTQHSRQKRREHTAVSYRSNIGQL